MGRGIISVIVLSVLLIISADGTAGALLAGGRPEEGKPARAADDSITVTRLAPVQQDNGVGSIYFATSNPPGCGIESESMESRISSMIGVQYFTWVIWDMTVFPQDAEITGVEIEHELYPDPGSSPETHLQYRSLATSYLSLPDCGSAWDELVSSSIYLDVEMGLSPGARHFALGDSALADVADAVANQGYFSIWICAAANPGSATLPGWNSDGPELIVSGRNQVDSEKESWGKIKASFRR